MSWFIFLVFHVVECWFFLGDVVRMALLTIHFVAALLILVSGAVLTTVGPLAAQPPVVAVVILCAAPQPEHHIITNNHRDTRTLSCRKGRPGQYTCYTISLYS